MQSEHEQRLANINRLNAYRAKLNNEQRRRAQVAEQVNHYCKTIGLPLQQASKAIQIALKQLEFKGSDEQAYAFGINSARIMALVSANSSLCSITYHKLFTLH